MLGQLHSIKTCIVCALCGAIVLAAIGCSSQQVAVLKESPQRVAKKERKAPLAEYEATLNPSDFDEEVERVLEEAGAADRPIQQVDIPDDSVKYEDEIRQGFRIQIFSSANIDEVTQTRLEAALVITTDSLYVVFDAPVYKIRVGDYATRYEANSKLPYLIDLGFRDAWAVPDRIIVRRSVRVSPDK